MPRVGLCHSAVASLIVIIDLVGSRRYGTSVGVALGFLDLIYEVNRLAHSQVRNEARKLYGYGTVYGVLCNVGFHDVVVNLF
jgi:hypothetical protein